ncbi:MAG: hypothetical protein R3A52_24110 [Polyangiales bacterium]
MRAPRLAAVVALSLTAGCWVTSSEHDATRRTLETRIHSLETNDQRRREQLNEAVEQATAQVRTLNEQLEQARTQTRNLADLGARLDTVEERIRTLTGALDEARHADESASQSRTQVANRIEAVERRLGILPAVDPSQVPADNTQLLRAGAAGLRRAGLPSRALAGALLQRAAQDPRRRRAALCPRPARREPRSDGRTGPQPPAPDLPQGDAVPDALATLAEAFVNSP